MSGVKLAKFTQAGGNAPIWLNPAHVKGAVAARHGTVIYIEFEGRQRIDVEQPIEEVLRRLAGYTPSDETSFWENVEGHDDPPLR